MTWAPSPGMSSKVIEKELQKQVIMFEDQVKRGFVFDTNTRFAEYANRWLENNKPPQLAPKTYERYKSLLSAINQGIGHIRLNKLQSNHLLAFYNNLREAGIKQKGSHATSDSLASILAQRSISKTTLAKFAGVSPSTVSAVCSKNGKISIDSAGKIANALALPTNKVFRITYSKEGLSEKTILHHHRLISAILSQATRDHLIPYKCFPPNRKWSQYSYCFETVGAF